MKQIALPFCILLLLGGCTRSVNDTEPVGGKTPSAGAEVAAGTPAVESEVTNSVTNAAPADAPIDAEVLLASTLEQAKTENKRVIVHLGAPW